MGFLGKFYAKRQVVSSKRNVTRKVIVRNRKKGNKIRSDIPIRRQKVLGNTLCSSVPRQVCSTNLNRLV